MKYEWKHEETGAIITVDRTVDDRHIGPRKDRDELGVDDNEAEWYRIMSLPNSDFEHMRDRGHLDR